MQAVPPLCPAQCRQPLPASLLHHHVLGPGMRLHQPYRHAFLTILFLINGYWVPLILNLPLLAWNAKKYVYPSRAGS
jgi:hypothetical protein